jgi:hypothetical protein
MHELAGMAALYHAPAIFMSPRSVMGCDERMAKFLRRRVDHLDHPIDMGLIDATQQIVENQYGFIRLLPQRQREEDAQSESVEVRLAEVGLRRCVLSGKFRVQINRGALGVVKPQHDLVLALAGVNKLIERTNLCLDFENNAVGKCLPLAFHQLICLL